MIEYQFNQGRQILLNLILTYVFHMLLQVNQYTHLDMHKQPYV